MAEENFNFTLSEDINGPLLASFAAVELAISFIINSFIFLYTLCHPRILKQPSIIFLTNFIVINLLINIIYLPFTIISAAAGEWVFGGSLSEKVASCKFVGFIYLYTIFLTTFTLTVISIDRFLLIVKSLLYKRFVKNWVAVIIIVAIWTLSGCIACLPLFLEGRYTYDHYIATCAINENDINSLVIVLTIAFFFCGAVIVSMTLLTFCVTRKFLKPFKRTRTSFSNEIQDHVYHRRMKKVNGLFTGILIATMITYLPAILSTSVLFVLEYEEIPGLFTVTIFQLYFLNTIVNPIIQSCFRKDLSDYLTLQYQKIRTIFNCCIPTKTTRDDTLRESNTLSFDMTTSNSEQ